MNLNLIYNVIKYKNLSFFKLDFFVVKMQYLNQNIVPARKSDIFLRQKSFHYFGKFHYFGDCHYSGTCGNFASNASIKFDFLFMILNEKS